MCFSLLRDKHSLQYSLIIMIKDDVIRNYVSVLGDTLLPVIMRLGADLFPNCASHTAHGDTRGDRGWFCLPIKSTAKSLLNVFPQWSVKRQRTPCIVPWLWRACLLYRLSKVTRVDGVKPQKCRMLCSGRETNVKRLNATLNFLPVPDYQLGTACTVLSACEKSVRPKGTQTTQWENEIPKSNANIFFNWIA